MHKSLALIAALGLALPAAPLLAQQGSVAVEHHDLDLSTPEGQKMLERRIDKAARAVCGLDDQRSGTRLSSREARKCVADATAQVERQLAGLLDKPDGNG